MGELIRTLHGDCRDILPTLPDASVHCVVCSPPYWGLRSYLPDGHADKHREIGSEATPEEWLATLVAVFREVRRVLRPEGTCWLNVGDAYSGGPSHAHEGMAALGAQYRGGGHKLTATDKPQRSVGLKPKDLLLLPARLALALQADGWWVRSAITWAKPNPMPESVVDRPTSASEMIYLLAKGQWKSRIVKFADLPSERVHLLQDFGLRPGVSPMAFAPTGDNKLSVVQICVLLAAAIFDRAQRQQQFSLPPFYSEVWQKGAGDVNSDFVRALPIEHGAAAIGARFLASHTTAKEFVAEMDSLGIALSDGDDLLIRGASAQSFDAPAIYTDRKGTITIHNAGKVSEIDFVHKQVIMRSPTSCNYFYDADAVREEPTGRTDHMEFRRWPDARDNTQGYQLDASVGRNLRNVWTIATEAFSGWTDSVSLVPVLASEAQELDGADNGADGDTARITSPDCLLHAGAPDRVPTGFYDGLSDAQLSRIRGTYDHPALDKRGGSDAIRRTRARSQSLPSTNYSLVLEDSEIATPNNTESRKTGLDHLFSEHAISSEETASGTPHTEPSQSRPALTCHGTDESRNESDSAPSPHPETVGDSIHRSSLACCCEYYRKVTTPTSHFATFPTALVERCVRAGTSERGCCAECGAPWVRQVERHSHVMHPTPERSLITGATRNALGGQKEWDAYIAPTTTGWAPSCTCGTRCVRMGCRLSGHAPLLVEGVCPKCGTQQSAAVVPCTVLDPFSGAGTTMLVADRLQRDAIGIELSQPYTAMAEARVVADAPLFAWADARPALLELAAD